MKIRIYLKVKNLMFLHIIYPLFFRFVLVFFYAAAAGIMPAASARTLL